MAQRISTSEYNNQKTEYTKKALADLNKQLGTLKRNIHTIVEDEQDSDEEEDDIEQEIIDKYKKKKYKREISHSQNKKYIQMEELLKKEETKSHYLILDLSNTKTELEAEKEKNNTLENLYTEWSTTIRIKLMVYLFVVNLIFGVLWICMPLKEKILLAVPFSGSIIHSLDFYTFFRKIKNYLKTK
jgi:hypothetical protein